MESSYRLITIPPSHFCEKARWAMDRYQLPYTEEPHPPLLHYWATRRAGGGRTVPVLVTDTGVYADSTDILKFVDAVASGGLKLYPEDPEQRRQVEELEDLFDEQLGPHARRLAYFYLLPQTDLLLESVLHRVSKGDQVLFRATLPLMRFLMRRGMRITPSGSERSLTKVREVFSAVGKQLADGRRYLMGDRFSAADLTFAALAAPMLVPRGYGSHLPSLAELPGAVLPLIEELRSTVAGGFGLRLYRDDR